jgi:Ser/Thr protein kinase RdoA (MazF antagonist)
MKRFPSKKNEVYRITDGEHEKVIKIFSSFDSFLNEKRMGDILKGTKIITPKRMSVNEESLTLTYEYIEALPVVDYIESENIKETIAIIDKVCKWLVNFYHTCYEKTGKQYILGDAHLRNFIYDETEKEVYGVDFEECRPGMMETDIARLYVFILHYDPAFTMRKRKIARYFKNTLSLQLALDDRLLKDEIKRETGELIERRKGMERLHV